MIYKLFTDGSARNNGYANAVGGWSWVMPFEDEQNMTLEYMDAGAVAGATNQQMELLSAYMGINNFFTKWHPKENDILEVYTDSAYLYNCWAQGWWKSWLLNNWRNAKKQPVANQSHWGQLIPFFKDKRVKFIKVKGHSDNKYNNKADELAQLASQALLNRIKTGETNG